MVDFVRMKKKCGRSRSSATSSTGGRNLRVSHSTLLGLQSRFGHYSLKFQVVYPRNGTALLTVLTPVERAQPHLVFRNASLFLIECFPLAIDTRARFFFFQSRLFSSDDMPFSFCVGVFVLVVSSCVCNCWCRCCCCRFGQDRERC